MLIRGSQLIGQPIITQAGINIGQIKDLIFDPAWFVVVGFVTEQAATLADTKLIPVEQLVNLSPHQLLVLNESVVTMQRFKDRVTMLLKNQNKLSLVAKTDQGKQLGKLIDLSINPITLRIETLTVSENSTKTQVKLADVIALENEQTSLKLMIKPEQTVVKKPEQATENTETVHQQIQEKHKQSQSSGIQKAVKKVESTVQSAVKDVSSFVSAKSSDKSSQSTSPDQQKSKADQEDSSSRPKPLKPTSDHPQKVEIHTDSVTIFDQSPDQNSHKP